MSPDKRKAALAAGIGSLLLLSFVSVRANDAESQADARRIACTPQSLRQSQDLRLAAKAQEGEEAFVRHVHFKRYYLQWTMQEAIDRANAAIRSRCGVALGFRPIDEASFPNVVAQNR